MKSLLMGAIMASLSMSVFAQEITTSDQGGVYGYTTIDYDSDTGQVTAYSETDMDSSIAAYYNVTLDFEVYDQNDNVVAQNWSDNCTTPVRDITAFAFSCQFAGQASYTYTAFSIHGVELNQTYGCDESCDNQEYIDAAYFSYLGQLNLQELGSLDMFGPGGPVPTDQPEVDTGETFDNVSLSIPPACGDSRDALIKDYQLSVYKPKCIDFVNQSTWDYYYQNLIHSYFSYAELTTNQTVGIGFAALQPYAYVDGLNAMGNQILAQRAPYGLTSAFRNPSAEIAAATQNNVRPAPNSRHEAGDGADLKTNWGGISIFDTIYNAAAAAGSHACFEPPALESFSHVHVDWRSLSGTSSNWGGQNDWPNPSATRQNGCPYNWEYH